jgi:hypothetical protein
MNFTLKQILDLVGPLDDSPGDETPRERFRRFLRENVCEVGQIRDYLQECLSCSGNQYSRALQDLVNHLGRSLGFEVTFGRYQGAQSEIGFDGHWRSPTGFHIVVEVKTTEVYAVKTAKLVGYVDQLISEKRITDWDHALGLYVVGRPDPEIKQLEKAIVAEKRTHQLRIISVDSLLSLAEMMNEYDVSHEDILAVLRPSGPTIDVVIDLMARLAAQREAKPLSLEGKIPGEELLEAEAVNYWLTPVKSNDEQTAEEVIKTLVGEEEIYAFGERTPGRKHLKQGDWICFYATAKGVVAHARVRKPPLRNPHPKVRDSKKYPWVFQLENVKLYLDKPVVIDTELRKQLDAFQGRDPTKSWAWFVQATRRITEHDFKLLIKH